MLVCCRLLLCAAVVAVGRQGGSGWLMWCGPVCCALCVPACLPTGQPAACGGGGRQRGGHRDAPRHPAGHLRQQEPAVVTPMETSTLGGWQQQQQQRGPGGGPWCGLWARLEHSALVSMLSGLVMVWIGCCVCACGGYVWHVFVYDMWLNVSRQKQARLSCFWRQLPISPTRLHRTNLTNTMHLNTQTDVCCMRPERPSHHHLRSIS